MNESERLFGPPVQVRDLLQQLPGLLASSEPTFEDPAVRRALDDYPSTRVAVASVGLLVNAFSANTAEGHALTRRVAAPVRRSIQAGSQIFAETLGKMLCSSGLARFHEATRHDTYFSGLENSDRHLFTAEDFHAAEEELRGFLGLGSKAYDGLDRVHQLVAHLASDRQQDQLSLASMLLEGAQRLMPDNSTIAYYRIEAHTRGNPRAALVQWRAYARGWNTPEVIGRGLQECGLAQLSLGNSAEAAGLLLKASKLLPFSITIAVTGMVASLLASDVRLAMHFARELSTRTSTSFSDLSELPDSIRGMSREWEQIGKTSRKVLETVLPAVPAASIRVIEEFLR